MRPYLAIIKDSFREALASRVLWALLILITLLVVALCPFHWKTTVAADVNPLDVRSTRHIANALIAGADDDAAPLQKYVWNALSSKTQERIRKRQNGERRGPGFELRRTIVDDINEIIQREDFYDASLWSDAKLSKRANELLDKAPLEGDSLKQFNRLALEAAIPGQLRPCPDEAVKFQYGTIELDLPTLRRRDAVEIIDNGVMLFMGILVGFFGIFAGVLVTAPIIPNMLNSGSLYVLLSKPIARPLLFIAKFVGGCSFVAINATYLIIALWLLLGLRFEMWKPQILWSIPLFLFTFAIFYSVSALSGLVWRSSIMAIVATIIFWFLCFTVGMTKGLMEQFVIVPNQISGIYRQADELFVARSNGELNVLDQATNTLVPAMENLSAQNRSGPEMMLGPRSSVTGLVYDEDNEELVLSERSWSQTNFSSGRKADGWKRKSLTQAPRNTRALFLHEGKPAVVADGGVFPVDFAAQQPEAEEKGTSIFGVFNIPALPSEEEEPVEVKLSQDMGPLPNDARVAFDPSSGTIYVHGNGELSQWAVQEGLFTLKNQIELDLSEVTHIASSSGVVAIAYRDSQSTPGKAESKTKTKLRVLKEQLQDGYEIDPAQENEVEQLTLSNDGRFLACRFKTEELRIFDLTNDKSEIKISGNKSVTSVAFDENLMLTTNANDQITKFSLPEFRVDARIRPNLPFMKKLYKLLVKPMYLVFPKPSELQNTMQYLITGKETVKVEGPGMGAGGRTVKLNPWQPVLSNSIFIGVMLLIGCIYVFRQDF